MTITTLCLLLIPGPQAEAQLPDDGQAHAQARRREALDEELFRLDGLGLRTTLEESGFEVDAFSTTDASHVIDGGLERNASALRALIDVSLTAKSEALFGLPNGLLFADLQLQYGEDASTEVGDLQAFSNIDAKDFQHVAEFWWQQQFWDSALELQAGRIDANGRFATVDNGTRFVNSSMGFSPTIFGMPTYPEPALGASARISPVEQFALSIGGFDADPSGSFFIVQADALWEGGRLGLGAWRHTAQLDRFDGGTEDGTSGTFLTFDQLIGAGIVRNDDRLSTFLQLGKADDEVSPISGHVGLGFVLENVGIHGKDALGLGVAHAELTDQPNAGFAAGRETAWELFYSFAPVDWLSLKPDLQFIQNPGGSGAIDDAWVFTLRSTFEF